MGPALSFMLHQIIIVVFLKWYMNAVIFESKGTTIDTKTYYRLKREYRKSVRKNKTLAKW